MKNFVITWKVVLSTFLFVVGGYFFINSFLIAYYMGGNGQSSEQFVLSLLCLTIAWLLSKTEE